MKISLIYFAVISAISVVMTVVDKRASIKGKRRISERALLCASALGGSLFMLITMILIRHKTRHVKFMAGIPLIIAVQFAFTFFIIYFLKTQVTS